MTTTRSLPVNIARQHGIFNLLNGIWPLAHRRSFEALLGPKVDRWLVYAVSGLLISIGASQLWVRDATDAQHARRIGIGAAATLAAIDVIYVARGRISPMYLIDALIESGWLTAWATTTSCPEPVQSQNGLKV